MTKLICQQLCHEFCVHAVTIIELNISACFIFEYDHKNISDTYRAVNLRRY